MNNQLIAAEEEALASINVACTIKLATTIAVARVVPLYSGATHVDAIYLSLL